jgi:prepilin signal peptidase PulO-like enzyme (type II secretory pathway)
MPKKVPNDKLSIPKYYYFQVFLLFVAIHKKIWHRPRTYNNSPGGIAIIMITIIECLNLYTLLKYIIFPASRGCAACQYDVRLTILGLIGAALFVINVIAFFGESGKQLPELRYPKAFKRLVFGYIILSILLAQ